MKLIFIFGILFFPTVAENLKTPSNVILWNVGQGSWVTVLDGKDCHHIDMGGEFFPTPVFDLCTYRNNRIYISHLDWDHINFIKRFIKKAPTSCIIKNDSARGSYKAQRWLSPLPTCPLINTNKVHLLYRPSRFLNPNQSSLIFTILQKILAPGDSPKSEEKTWASRIPPSVEILVLGHHGSYTSTSKRLLTRGQFRLAIASARKDKFGHPHKKTRELLKRFKVPLLTTQDWGHIHFEL